MPNCTKCGEAASFAELTNYAVQVPLDADGKPLADPARERLCFACVQMELTRYKEHLVQLSNELADAKSELKRKDAKLACATLLRDAVLDELVSLQRPEIMREETSETEQLKARLNEMANGVMKLCNEHRVIAAMLDCSLVDNQQTVLNALAEALGERDSVKVQNARMREALRYAEQIAESWIALRDDSESLRKIHNAAKIALAEGKETL